MKTSQMVTALELPNLVHDWLKAVVEGPKQLGVQVVEPGQLVGAVEAPVADQPPDQISVLLFDVGVVVLVERAAAAELDLLAPAVAEQGLVEELGTIVNVDSQQRKGQLVANAPEAGKDFALALSKDRDEFGPASLQVGRRECVDPVPSEPGPTVRDKVHLDKARPTLLLPVANPHRDLALESGRGAQAAAVPMRLSSQHDQVALDCGSTRANQQGPYLGPRSELAVRLEQAQEVAQKGPQALRTDVARGLPQHSQRRLEWLAIATAAHPPQHARLAPSATQHGDGVLSVVASGQAEGIEEAAQSDF